MTHRVQLIASVDRTTPFCSCGDMIHREYFGDRRTANATSHIFRHLESVFHMAEGLDPEGSAEYHINVSDDMKCPVCKEDLELSKDDLGLLAQDSPSVVNCENGHDFDAYLKDRTVFLFLEGADTHSPFSTT